MDYYDHLIEIEEAQALLENDKARPGSDKSRRFFSHKDFVKAQDKTTQDKTTQDKRAAK